MNKIGDIIELEIIDVNYDGLGVARLNNQVYFVERAIKDEIVKARIDYIGKNFTRCHATEIIKSSIDRASKLCDTYPLCGGCQMLHIKYNESLKYKLNATNDTLRRIGHIDYKITKILGMENPFAYRNKVQVPVGTDKNGNLMIGYYMSNSHKIVPFKKCLLESDEITDILIYVKNICNDYKISAYNEDTKKGCLRHFLVRENNKNEHMFVFITNEKKINNIDEIVKKLVNKFPSIISVVQNYNDKGNNVILGDKSKVLYGKDEIIDTILGINYSISHKSFFQVNRSQTEKLYSTVIDYIGSDINNANVIDAYCGVGSISLCLSKKAKKVYGIEVVNEAINDAINNAKLNNITNTEFIVGKVEDKIGELLESNKIDCVVIDPPRKGLEGNVCESLNNSGINKIVYVSCNPATLARDLNILSENYEIKDFTLVDMFAFTSGVESVVKLERR